MAVGCGFRDFGCGNCAACSGLVDDDRLPQSSPQFGGDQACDDIDSAAAGCGNGDADRSLRLLDARERCGENTKQRQEQRKPEGFFIAVSQVSPDFTVRSLDAVFDTRG